MTIIELGARLREAREGLNWTVADVANTLKIPARILSGIEEGSDNLPRTVYTFHFIKDYARHLGFSAEETASMTGALEGFDKAVQPVRDASVQITPVRPSPVPKFLGAAVKLALFAALGFGGYNAYLHFFAERDAKLISAQTTAQQAGSLAEKSPAWNAPQAVAPASDAGRTASSAAGTTASAQQQDAANASLQPAEHAEAKTPDQDSIAQNDAQKSGSAEKITLPPQPAPNWDAPAAQPPQSTFVTAAAAQDPAAPHAAYLLGQERPAQAEGVPLASLDGAGRQELPPIPEGMHQVIITADQGDCWMGFEPDGKKQQRMLHKGDTFTMTFSEALQLRLGNAAAVRIAYDGTELDRASAARPMNMSFPPAQR